MDDAIANQQNWRALTGIEMQAPFELTEGQRRLKQIIADFPADSPHWNEAQNRFQFIDRLLLECLGWSHPYINVERTDDLGGKADYLLGNPPRAVLEAKKEALAWDIVPSGSPSKVRKIEPLISGCKNFRTVVLQVIPYCAIHGAQIAIVCNGPQLAIFQAISPGMPPLEGECYLFDGFNAYIENFPLLWKLLSPEGIAENRAYRELALHRNPRIPPKASSGIPNPNRWRYRSGFQENLRFLASFLLEDIEEHPQAKREFYRDCYVPIEANSRHLLLSKNIIAARYRRVSGDAIPPEPFANGAPNATGKLELNESIVAASLGSRPIVVLGDVGVGKTSFFENLFQQLEAGDKQQAYFIHINLGVKATLASGIKDHVLREIPTTLRKRYSVDIDSADFVHAIYYEEIAAFDRGIYGPLKEANPTEYELRRSEFLQTKLQQRDTHLHASLGHLAQGRGKQIILVIDNADQRDFATQQDAFLIAQELAATGNVLVFVALRPSTFYQSKLSGALSGYQNRVLTIAPPPADEVLTRRITFALRVAEGKAAPGALKGISLHLQNIVYFLRATLRSIHDNEKIQLFLSNITGGNTRMVIELVSGFCGSPNVDSEKIVRIEHERGVYKVPLHEFQKHSLLGEYAHYNALSSVVACNMFDVSTADPREHFLSSLILGFLSSPLGIKDNDGFVTGANIVREMAVHGFVEEQVHNCLRRLASKRLVETPHAHYREIDVEDSISPEQFVFRVTSIGVYHLRNWIGSFEYLDAMSIDAPIFDTASRELVFRYAPSFDIADRLKRTEEFRRYLETQWLTANINTAYLDMTNLLNAQDDTFESVRRFIKGPGRR